MMKRIELIVAMLAIVATASGEVIDTPKMVLEFDAGWLVRWENKETGETMNFGKESFDASRKEDLPYMPGPWFVEWQKPKDPTATGTTWGTAIKSLDDEAVELTQHASREGGGTVQSLQWALRLPFDQMDAFHYPRGLGQASIVAKGDEGGVLADKSYYFNNRPAQLSFHEWRQRYYIIQGKTGGLLIHVDDTNFDHRQALEFRKINGGMVISNRSIMPPPWKPQYTGCRWVVRQYSGWVNVGAQLYQDYLAQAYQITPLAERPTAWVLDLAYCATKPGMTEPMPIRNKRRTFNYTDNWDKSIAWREQWLDNLAQVLNPNNVMFYTTGWNYSGMDTLYPNHSINPFFAYMAPKLRKRGYHMMLHFNAHYAFAPSVGFTRFLENQWHKQGKKDQPGIYHCALRNKTFTNNSHPGKYYQNQGVTFTSKRYIFTPAYEAWRRIWVASVVSAVKASGSDMIHVDVPSIGIDLRNNLYGMNTAQGLREEFKLLRETLDENGLEHVAIATEVTPSEPILPYVDMAQCVRDVSILNTLNKRKLTEDKLIELQGAEGEAKLRAEMAALAKKRDVFDVTRTRAAIAGDRRLGEPSLDSMVMGKYIKGYPHLGAIDPLAGGWYGDPNAAMHNQVVQALKIWYSIAHNTLLHDILKAPALMDRAPFDSEEALKSRHASLKNGKLRKNGRILTKLQYYTFALARFWQAQEPKPVEPSQWQRGDIALYTLKNGSLLRMTRSAPTTLRFAFSDGSILAELDVFDGWQNHELLNAYEPTWLRDQIDEFVTGE